MHLLISVRRVVNFFKQWWWSTQRCRAPSSTVDILPEQQLGVSGEILTPTEVLSPVPLAGKQRSTPWQHRLFFRRWVPVVGDVPKQALQRGHGSRAQLISLLPS